MISQSLFSQLFGLQPISSPFMTAVLFLLTACCILCGIFLLLSHNTAYGIIVAILGAAGFFLPICTAAGLAVTAFSCFHSRKIPAGAAAALIAAVQVVILVVPVDAMPVRSRHVDERHIAEAGTVSEGTRTAEESAAEASTFRNESDHIPIPDFTEDDVDVIIDTLKTALNASDTFSRHFGDLYEITIDGKSVQVTKTEMGYLWQDMENGDVTGEQLAELWQAGSFAGEPVS